LDEERVAINQLRVLKAGFAAGIVILVSGVAMVPVVGDQMEAALKNRGLPPG
jgi:F0F1-type ATP synthase membrane subunit c/vacuolar-type H+-ATPase subunit K